VAFEALYWMQALLSRGLYKDCVHGLPSTASSPCVTDVKAGHSPRDGGGGWWRRRDRWCVTETMEEVSYSERRERCGRASFLRIMHDTVVVGDPLMAGQAVILLIPYLNGVIKHISGRTGASLWLRCYTRGFSIGLLLRNDNASCRRHRRRWGGRP